MTETDEQTSPSHVRQRLLDAGLHCFLEKDYHDVTMRKVAAMADTNMSMVYYYFGNKEGLFEEVLRTWLQPMIDNMGSTDAAASPDSFEAFFHMYYRAALVHPRFPLLIMKTLNNNEAPGARFLCETVLERGRRSGVQWINKMKSEDKIAPDIDPELLRIAAVSMAMLPMLIRDFLAGQLNEPIDEAFFGRLAAFYDRILTYGIVQAADTDTSSEQ